MRSIYLTLVVVLATLLPQSLTAQPYLVGYWENYLSSATPNFNLDETDGRYDVINVAFATARPGTEYDMEFTPCCGTTQAEFIEQVRNLQAAGKTVNISIGGANAPISMLTEGQRDTFANTMLAILDTFGFDGIDIDLESSSLSIPDTSTIANPTNARVINLIDAFRTILSEYEATNGKKMFLSTAPETAFVQGAQSNWGGIWGAYLPLIDALRDDWDLVHVQLYNTGSMFGIDGGIYTSGNADFIVSQVEAMIQGFTAVGSGGEFRGLPASVIAAGLPACPMAAGSGFVEPIEVFRAMNYLLGKGPQPGDYTLVGGPYPDLGGMMTWSVNWDKSATCATEYEYATNYVDIFSDSTCLRPYLGPDKNACALGLPIQLESGTLAGPDVTYTWTNMTTGEVLTADPADPTNLSVDSLGTYSVTRDSLGCSRTDQIKIIESLETPLFVGETELCNTVPGTLTLSNAAGYPEGTTYQWAIDGEDVPGATDTLLTDVRSAGVVTLTASSQSCEITEEIVVSSFLPKPVDACVRPGESADLSITEADQGPYSWYDQPTGGMPLDTGVNYSTPPLMASTTYYLQDEGSVGTVSTGPKVGDFDALQSFASPTLVTFDVAEALVLNSVDVIPLIFCFAQTVSVEVQDAAGTVLATSTISVEDVDMDCGTIYDLPATLDFGGLSLPAGVGYRIVVTSEVKSWFYEGVTFPLEYSPYFTITGSDAPGRLPAILNWAVEGGNCARLPVVATVAEDCPLPTAVDVVQAENNQFSFFPNPAHDQITVAANPGSTLSLLSINGQVLSTWSNIAPGQRLTLPSLPAGSYLLREERAAETQVKIILIR